MKYREKPVVVEAFQLGIDCIPEWFVDAVRNSGVITLKRDLEGRPRAEIITIEGTMNAGYADYIIRCVHGEIYPCKPTIFRMTYEEMREND